MFVTDKWLQDVELAMSKRAEPIDKKGLALLVDVEPSTVTRMFQRKRAGYLLVQKIADVLGVPAPQPSGDELEWLSIGQRLRSVARPTFAEQLGRLRRLVEAHEEIESKHQTAEREASPKSRKR